MADISLTASMRSNLLSLQNTQSLMDMTQERLSTGKKVNSAIDNPASYYASQSLTNRASDLSALLDSMGQGIQTIKAANEGIEAITAFSEQAKAVANSAFDTSDTTSIETSVKQFNNILDQLDTLSKDSGYKGVNLLNGDNLKVTFNEDRTSFMEIEGQHADSKSIGIERVQKWTTDPVDITTDIDEYDPAGAAALAQGDVVIHDGKLYQASEAIPLSVDGDADGTMDQLGAFDPAKFKLLTDDADIVTAATTAGTDGVTVTVPAKSDKAAIEKSITEVEDAINRLRDMASIFGNNYSIVQNRENFTESLVNVLEEGSDKLVLADMNEESANMLALQTRQQLAINSLSLASQAAQGVLKLF